MMSKALRGMFVGYAATAVMDNSQSTLIPSLSCAIEVATSSDKGSGGENASSEASVQESSPAKVARLLAGLAGIELTHEDAERWGDRVHWAYGITWGATYMLFLRGPGLGSGLLYGAGLWLGSDELLLWKLGIAKSPTEYPLKTHLQALAAHLFFGATVGLLARGIRH